MSPTLDAFLRSWPYDPWLLAGLLGAAGLYIRGWLFLRRRDPGRWHTGRLWAFLGGLLLVFLALASPIEPFAALVLQVHMLQHLLLMMFAPPLLWLGAPLFPLLRGLPKAIRVVWVAPLLRSPLLRRLGECLTHPAAALPIFTAVAWLGHVPAFYETALRSSFWHYVQHACFFGAGLLFWYPVVRPYPSRPRWSAWLLVPYLLLADVQNTALAALLTFASRVLYPYYLEVPSLGGGSVLEDQSASGVLMWVPGSLVFLLPLFAISVQMLSGPRRRRTAPRLSPSPLMGEAPLSPSPLMGEGWGGGEALASVLSSTPHPNPPPQGGREKDKTPPQGGRGQETRARISLPLLAAATAPADVARLPLLGRFLRWRHARLAVQLPLLILAGVVITDGLAGPRVGSMNLAGVLPWIHWRGLLILGLLIAGNVFCMACPFLLPRTLARRWLPGGRPWPRWLRSKWLAVALLVLFLWAYETFALWDSPWWTAWIALGYFAGALVVDGFFRGAAFCKYVCPIGQFNFVQALVSPFEVKARDPQVCASCRSKDCLRGRDGSPGCELHLFQPRKAGNLDCTFCLDCLHACPHDNVGILARLPASELWREGFRSGVGRLARRTDLAAVVLVLVFGAYANAAGMVGPVVRWREEHSPLVANLAFYFLALVAVPLLLVSLAAAVGRGWAQARTNWLQTATRYSFALVPLGFAMWLAHYGYHLLTSYDTVIPVTQRLAADLGASFLGEPQWLAGCCRTVAGWLPRLEVLSLDLGLLLSLYTGYRMALGETSHLGRALKLLLPWAVLMVLLFSAGVWIVLQPMQMRGTP